MASTRTGELAFQEKLGKLPQASEGTAAISRPPSSAIAIKAAVSLASAQGIFPIVVPEKRSLPRTLTSLIIGAARTIHDSLEAGKVTPGR